MDGRVEVAGRLDAADDLLDTPAMALLGGAHEVVVGEAHAVAQAAVLGHHAVGELDGRDPLFTGRALDVLAVLVGAGEEIDRVARHAPVAGERVADGGGEDMPDVGQTVDVIDRGGEVEGAHGTGDCSKAGVALHPGLRLPSLAVKPKGAPRPWFRGPGPGGRLRRG